VTTMEPRTLFRFTAVLLLISAVAVTVGRLLHPALDHAGMTSVAWAPAHWLWLIGLVTGMAGVTGLYLRQRGEVGLLGFLGAATAWTGMALMSGAIYFEAVVQPGLIEAQPALVASFVEYRGMGAYLPVFLASAVAFGLGFLAFGVAMFRAGRFPKWAIGLMAAGAVIGGPQGLLPPVVSYGAMLALGLGIAGLGFALWGSVGPEPDQGLRVGAAAGPDARQPERV
jgi:hypothetical protein